MNIVNWNNETKQGAINFRASCYSVWDASKGFPIWRSGSTENLTSFQANILYHELGIRTWFCLAESNELKNCQLSLLPQIEKVFCSLSDKHPHLEIPLVNDYVNLYWQYLTECSNKIFNLFTQIASLKDHEKILISCYAGKDRTGLICALITGLLISDKQLIIDDYCESSIFLLKQIDYFQTNWEKRKITKMDYSQRFKYLNDIICLLLDKIEMKYGNIYSYLISIGINEQTLNNVRLHFKPYIKNQYLINDN